MHSDGTVLDRGQERHHRRRRNVEPGSQGRKISITATNGVTMDGGSGAVDVDTQAGLSLKGTTVKVAAKAAAEFKAAGANVITGAPVKIN